MIRALAAIDDKRGLATDTGIPWNLPWDRDHVHELTKGGTLLMGYGTYREFKHSSFDRTWYVVTDNTHPVRDGFKAVTDLDAFMANPPADLWLFGGAMVFAQTIAYADQLYLTRVAGDFGCTKFFPEFKKDFALASRSPDQTENGVTFHYETWQRR